MEFKSGRGVEYEEGDLIISGGEVHLVEDIPTASISAGAMDTFLQEEADRLEREKAAVARRAALRASDPVTDDGGADDGVAADGAADGAAQHGADETPTPVRAPDAGKTAAALAPTEAMKRPGSDEIRAAMKLASVHEAPTEVLMPDAMAAALVETQDMKRPSAEAIRAAMKGPGSSPGPAPEPSARTPSRSPADPDSEGTSTLRNPADSRGERNPAGAAPRRSTRRSAVDGSTASKFTGPQPKKKVTSTEKWLYAFIGFCLVGGALNFWLRSGDEPPAPPAKAPDVLMPQDRLWLKAEEIAAQAQSLTREGSRLNATGDKAVATEKYKEAKELWTKVFQNLDEIERLGIDFDDPGYARWQKKITIWTMDLQESGKFQTLQNDDWDFEEELRKAREKNRLDEEKDPEEPEEPEKPK